MKKLTQTILITATSLLTLLTVGCGSTQTKKKSDVITIATQASHPPFAYLNKDKKMVGFDITLIHDLCAFMLVECKVVHDKRGELLPNLQQGKYDAVVAAVSINDENKQKVDFTDSYYEDSFALIINNNAKVDTNTMQDATIAVLHTSDAEKRAEQQYPEANITAFKTQSSAFLALAEATKDAVYADEATIDDWIAEHNNSDLYTVITEGQGMKEYGIALQQDSRLTSKFNKALTNYKKSGEYQKLYDKYFTKSEWEQDLPAELMAQLNI